MSISEQVKELREIANNLSVGHNMPISLSIENFRQAADTIEALSAKLQAANMENGGRWISCEDRLPDKHIDVLVSFGDKDSVIAWYSEVNKHWKNSSTDNVITADVVAWQPLPEPYRP